MAYKVTIKHSGKCFTVETDKGLCCVGYPASDMVIELEYPDEDFEPWI
jgi:hypothetical protein